MEIKSLFVNKNLVLIKDVLYNHKTLKLETTIINMASPITKPVERQTNIQEVWKDYQIERGVEQRNRLMENYLSLVESQARRIHSKLPNCVELDDLISAGVFGLEDAIEAFDPERGVKFETYSALRIRGSILDELRNMDLVPRGVRAKSTKLKEAQRSVEAEYKRPANDYELAEKLNISLEEFMKLQNDANAVRVSSLNSPGSYNQSHMGEEDREFSFNDVIADKRISESLQRVNKKEELHELLKGLSREEQLIIHFYYYQEMTMGEIGTALDISESRVSQVHSNLLSRFKTTKFKGINKRILGVNKRISREMKEKGFTQKLLASSMGHSPIYIRNRLMGNNSWSEREVYEVSERLDSPVDFLVHGRESEGYNPILVKERIIKLLEDNGETVASFSRRSGVCRQFLRRFSEDGGNSTRIVDKICRNLNTSLDFLILGIGPPVFSEEMKEKYPEYANGCSPLEFSNRLYKLIRRKYSSNKTFIKKGSDNKHFASSIGMSQTGIYKNFNGQVMRLPELLKTRGILDTSLNYLLYGIEENKLKVEEVEEGYGEYSHELLSLRLINLIRNRNLRVTDVANNLGLGKSFESYLYDGYGMPLTAMDITCKGLLSTPNYLMRGYNDEDQNVSLDQVGLFREKANYSLNLLVQRVEKLLEEKRMSIEDLASSSGISDCTIYRIFNQKLINPRIRTFDKLCKGLKVTPNELFYDWGNGSPN